MLNTSGGGGSRTCRGALGPQNRNKRAASTNITKTAEATTGADCKKKLVGEDITRIGDTPY